MRALEAPRHDCHACGACCHGTRVRLVDEDEIARIEAAGAALGVERPVVDGRLRHRGDGACVFLGADARCEIHRRFGADHKPELCRQYPFVVHDAESGPRVGVDPGCFSLWQTWGGGAPLPDDTPLWPGRSRWEEAPARSEAAVVALLGRPGLGVAGALALLVGTPPEAGLPPGMLPRLVARAAEADLGPLLRREDTGAAVRGALQPVVAHVEALHPAPADLAPAALDPETERYAVAMVRRLVYLRLLSTLPVPQPVGVLGLCGALLAGLADPTPATFGPAFAAWLRALRAPPFWRALLPGPDTLLWLVTGERGR